MSTHQFIMKYIRELNDCKPVEVKHNPVTRSSVRKPRWIRPPENFAKIRFDGAVNRANDEGSFNAVCRDGDGNYLGSSVIRCTGLTDPATLEALACREALALAQDLSLSHVIVASDSKGVVQDIKLGIGGMYATIVKEIRETMELFQECTVIFEGRETNQEAHSLAKHAFGLDELYPYEH
ncbi:uncharacterized protein [Aegilops tauschii subsp. strangulata]|uniref:uncharacterized protein n=1 Tax=Aegilops tauschii subsp. strangulata TaxID=200361 RepID=UPI003CC863EF